MFLITFYPDSAVDSLLYVTFWTFSVLLVWLLDCLDWDWLDLDLDLYLVYFISLRLFAGPGTNPIVATAFPY